MNEFEVTRSIAKISTWGKFTGIMLMISGALSAIPGLFFFVIGAAPGVVMFISGYFLFKAGQDASRLKDFYDQNVQGSMLKNMGTYLQIQGILIIVGIVLSLLILIIYGALLVAVFSAY